MSIENEEVGAKIDQLIAAIDRLTAIMEQRGTMDNIVINAEGNGARDMERHLRSSIRNARRL